MLPHQNFFDTLSRKANALRLSICRKPTSHRVGATFTVALYQRWLMGQISGTTARVAPTMLFDQPMAASISCSPRKEMTRRLGRHTMSVPPSQKPRFMQ